MKNGSLIVIALLGISLGTYAQDGTKKQEPNKTERRKPVRKEISVEKKKEVPAEKVKK